MMGDNEQADDLASVTTASQQPTHLVRERESGNEEYKWKLLGLTEIQRRHRSTQMNWRLNEGGGTAVYRLGSNFSILELNGAMQFNRPRLL